MENNMGILAFFGVCTIVAIGFLLRHIVEWIKTYATAPYQIGKWYALGRKDPWGRRKNIVFKVMDIRDGYILVQYEGATEEKDWVPIEGTRYYTENEREIPDPNTMEVTNGN